ncbi:glycine cleavage system aminomethyltransferase GcvT [Evansella sp. AB-P1]|uniref:glycine cleavage system aminomethyltransferase GcvT n=1 Tax=Evansella sp. AB-P1 TaxID=3037653 RepID=UPI00241E1835|nr:glycine cleavage system aminomethyltransferase GcvT [Evansella sp. AB-P1]MDG5788716.1 glycine cleavage system aminomethyltransferase GcvT [Evansella sp. AB-P1]
MSIKRTPLYEVYKEYNGKTIDFGGWELPVQFAGIKEEHEVVRTKVGLFDVSHMGEIEVKGEDALSFLQKILTNNLEKVKSGACQYTAMCYEDGGTIDDLVVYKRSERDFLLIVNASNIEKDYQWLRSHVKGNVIVNNVSDEYAQLAIQGPAAEQVTQKLTTTNLSEITFFKFQDDVSLANKNVLISRTGYTGEDGFEIYCRPDDAAYLWHTLIEAGSDEGIQPCGLGARDTLRFEARLPLYGQELSKDISPVEAGIGFAVKTDKEVDFFGKDVLKQQKESGASRKLVGLEMIDKGIPRTNYEVFKDGVKIGFVTTGTQSPTLKKNVGLALIDQRFKALDTEVEVQVRKRRLKAKVVATPFYKRT